MSVENIVGDIRSRVRDLRAGVDEDSSTCADLDRIATAADRMSSLLQVLDAALQGAADETARRKIRHDLRTPVNQMLGYCELLQEEAEDGEDQALLEPLQELHALISTLPDRVTELVPSDLSSTITDMRPVVVANKHAERGTVLVVDDNAANRDMLQRRLDRDGFDTIAAGDGAEALEIARSASPDVILLDIMMPVMDGNEALDRLKADPDLRHIPVIMLTSLDDTASIISCIERGAEDHLPKPFDPVLLRARLGACLEKKQLHDREQSYLAEIVVEKRRADGLLNTVIPLGVSLSETKDFNQMLARILDEACRFCGADGGVLYLHDEDLGVLTPMLRRFDSLGADQAAPPSDSSALEAIPLQRGTERLRPAVAAALDGVSVNLEDLEHADDHDLSGIRSFDDRRNYRSQSLLSVPIRSPQAGIIGVLQLVNATHASEDRIVGFSADVQEMVESLSSLAAVALTSYTRESKLREKIRALEIQVDEAKQAKEVSEITETEYFKQLRERARALRSRGT